MTSPPCCFCPCQVMGIWGSCCIDSFFQLYILAILTFASQNLLIFNIINYMLQNTRTMYRLFLTLGLLCIRRLVFLLHTVLLHFINNRYIETSLNLISVCLWVTLAEVFLLYVAKTQFSSFAIIFYCPVFGLA